MVQEGFDPLPDSALPSLLRNLNARLDVSIACSLYECHGEGIREECMARFSAKKGSTYIVQL